MIQDKLINKFGGHINHMSCVYLNNGEQHLRDLIVKVVKAGSLDTVIEIGTYQGVSAAIISEYAQRVFTIDIEEQDLTKPILQYLGVGNVSLNIVKNRAQEKSLVADLLDNCQVDLCFIDGEHFHGELKKDFDMCKKCKNILVHDYDESFPEVWDFCNALEGYTKTVAGSFILLQKEVKKRGRKKKQPLV